MRFPEIFSDPGARPGLYLITDRTLCPGGLTAAVREALEAGVRFVQLREKDLEGGPILRLANELRALTDEYKAGLVINDRVDIALLSGADGVHLGRSSLDPGTARGLLGPDRLIGVSTHSVEEAKEAEEAGADFVTFGPVFHTPSKAGYGPPVGPKALKEAAGAINIPVYGLGGVKAPTVGEVLGAGASGIAVISAILGSPDVKGNAARLLARIVKNC